VKQHARVIELLVVAAKQNAGVARNKQGVGASKSFIRLGCQRKVEWAGIAPHPDRKREGSINSKQITMYVQVLAGKQKAGLNNAGHGYAGNNNASKRSQGAGHGNAGNGHVGNGEASQNYRPRRAANSGGGAQLPKYPRASGMAQSQHNDDDSAMERAGYQRNPLSD
jgi:hypothetical protein